MTTTQRISIGAVLSLALAASAMPASARGLYSPPNAASAQARQARQATKSSPPATPPPAIVRGTTTNNGFDWTDAGIGAAGALAVSLVGLGGTLAGSHRRSHRTSYPAATN